MRAVRRHGMEKSGIMYVRMYMRNCLFSLPCSQTLRAVVWRRQSKEAQPSISLVSTWVLNEQVPVKYPSSFPFTLVLRCPTRQWVDAVLVKVVGMELETGHSK